MAAPLDSHAHASERASVSASAGGGAGSRAPGRILLAEGRAIAAATLAAKLGESGMQVDVSTNGIDALHRLLTESYDVAILEVMLTGLDGFAVLQRARKASVHTPVLFLTARDGIEDRVHGLELGADDYLVKPYAYNELLARLRVILRRRQAGVPDDAEPTSLTLADLRLDLLRQRVTRGADRIDLTRKEFALLSLLMRRAGDVMSRAMLAEKVWDMHFDSDTNVLEVAVRRLRTKLDDPYPVKLLHTVRGVGYVLECRANADPARA